MKQPWYTCTVRAQDEERLPEGSLSVPDALVADPRSGPYSSIGMGVALMRVDCGTAVGAACFASVSSGT